MTHRNSVLQRLMTSIFFIAILLSASFVAASAAPRKETTAPVDPVYEMPKASTAPWPTQLVASTGDIQPTLYGPNRTTYDEPVPAHAYSPFDESKNRDYPCPPQGCDFRTDVVLVKLEESVQVSKDGPKSRLTTNDALNSLLTAKQVVELIPLFPKAVSPVLGALVSTPDGGSIPMPDLTRWYRATLDVKSAETQDVQALVEELNDLPGVAYVEPDYLRKLVGDEAERQIAAEPNASSLTQSESTADFTDPLYAQQWHLSAIGVPQAWSYLESQGLSAGGSRDIVVAVIDTGVDYNHPDLTTNMWVNSQEIAGNGIDDDSNGFVDDIHGANMVSNDHSGDPLDDHGHGTHVAGIIAAQAGNDIGGVGIAYNVQIMAIKAAQYSGFLSASDIAQGIYYAVAQGADVINMSFGGYARSQLEEDALAVAFGQAVLVAAAGNDGKVNLPCPLGRDQYPAAYNWVLGVMARQQFSDPDGDYLAAFSNYDCKLQDSHEYELMVPGVDIWSTLPSNQYAAWDGTSMAAPVVAGIAALARTKWSDKDVYSSRFIMGQIATTGGTMQAYTPPGGAPVFYYAPNALSALTTVPQPKLSYLEHWTFDTTEQSLTNDSDGVVDAGETIDLAIVIRNHWGKAAPVSVVLEPWAQGAFQPDPYVTMITGTVDYGAVGSFNIDDNGFIYEDDAIVGVQHPFRFTVDSNTPNDHVIPFRLTMNAGNGYDAADPNAPYVFQDYFYLIVQRGRELPRIIDHDMTMTKDNLWLVPDATLIEAGVTVTVTEGTQVQFWSADPNDPYSQNAKPKLQVEGDFLVLGTQDEPVEFFAGALYLGHKIEMLQQSGGMPRMSESIAAAMEETQNMSGVVLRYARVMNPYVGATSIVHSYFAQELFDCIYERTEWGTNCRGPEVYAPTIADSVFYKLGSEWAGKLSVVNGNRNLYDSSQIRLSGSSIQDSVFLKNYKLYESQWGDREYWVSEANGPGYAMYEPAFLRTAFPVQYNGKTYVALSAPFGIDQSSYLDLAETFANQFGGHVVTINDAAENSFLSTYRNNNFNQEVFEQTYPDMDCGDASCWSLFEGGGIIGLTDRENESQFKWISGEPVTFTSWGWNEPNNGGYTGTPCEWCGQNYVQHNGGNWDDTSGVNGPVILELPGAISQAKLSAVTTSFLPGDLSVNNNYVAAARPIGDLAPTVTPFLDLPFAYDNFAEAAQGNVNGQGSGRVLAWFDHSSPDYTSDGQTVVWSGANYSGTLYSSIDTCWMGMGCFDGHNGIDFTSRQLDEPVRAAASGTVVSVKFDCSLGTPCNSRYGNQVWIDHGNGYATLYGHLKAVSVNAGDTISTPATQPLGTMGSTGDSRGTHLHFGVYYDANSDLGWTEDEAIDPFGWIGPDTDPAPLSSSYLWVHSLKSQATVDPNAGGGDPGAEVVLISASGNITVVIPTYAVTETVDFELWEVPSEVDLRIDNSNRRSMGKSLWLRRSDGLGNSLQSSLRIEIANTFSDTRHLNTSNTQLLKYLVEQWGSYWNSVGGGNLSGQQVFQLDWLNDLGQFTLAAPLQCSDYQEPNDTYYAARLLTTDNAPAWGSFDIENDEDWYRVSAIEGERYLIYTSIDMMSQENVDTIVDIYAGDGTTLLVSDDNSGTGNASLIDWVAPYTGIFFVRVAQAPNGSYGCDAHYYTLRMSWQADEFESAFWAVRQQFIADGSFNTMRNNAFLNVWWDPDIDHWMQFDVSTSRGYSRYLTGNWWGTTNNILIDAGIQDYNDDFNKGRYVYDPKLTTPPGSAYPFVTDVILSTEADPDASIVGAEPVTFTVTFNRDMDQSILPLVSFGPDVPQTDYTVHPIDGGWADARTWWGVFNITPVTGDGYQFMRIAGAVAADDPWLVTGDDSERFRFEVVTQGSDVLNLQATGGEGYIDLAWTQDDFDLLAGYNLYWSDSYSGTYTLLNTGLIPAQQKTYRDTNVQPGQPYYYKFTVVKTDLTESDFSNIASATPLDTIPPVIVHTPMTSASPGLALTLAADVTDNVAVRSVLLYYRSIGTSAYTSATMVKTTGNRYSATIPGTLMVSPGVEYYIEASDGVSVQRTTRPEFPHQIVVVDKPVVTSVSPQTGPASGGTLITVAGSNFKSGLSVTVGGGACADVTRTNSNQLKCTTPAHFPATVDVSVINPDSQSGTLLRGFTYQADTASMSLPNTGGGQNAIVTVPVNADNVSGFAAASFTVTYDSSVLKALDGTSGNLTPGWATTAYTGTLGQIRLSMASSNGPVSGSGVLANLEFEVLGSPGMTSTLGLSNVGLNAGAISVDTANGSFSVDLVYAVSGNVGYWVGNVGVPEVQLTLAGDRIYSGQSGTTGNYSVGGAARGTYTLTPSKSGNVTGITAYDASLALQHDAGVVTLTGAAATAADVDKSGQINSMDAFYILQKSVDLLSVPFPGAGKVWEFIPGSRTYTDLAANQSGQDFVGVLLGDASGNWSMPTMSPARSGDASSITLKVLVGESTADGVTSVQIELEPGDVPVQSLEMTFQINSQAVSVNQILPGSSIADWMIVHNEIQSGQTRIALAGARPVTTVGPLLDLQLHSDVPIESVLMALSDITVNEDITAVQVVMIERESGHVIYLPMIQR